VPRKPRPTSFNKAPLGRSPVERDPFRAGGAGSAQATSGHSSQMPNARRRNALTTDEAPSHQSMAKLAISAQAASLRMGKGAVRSEPVSPERNSEYKEDHRDRSANLMADIAPAPRRVRANALKPSMAEYKRETSSQAASLRMGKGAVVSEPVSSEKISAHKDEHRARSVNLLADIAEYGQERRSSRDIGDVKAYDQIKGRLGQRQRFDVLEEKNRTQGYLSHSDKLERSAIGSKLRSREESAKVIVKDETGKEIGFHRLASSLYFQTRTAGDMGLTTAIHTTTNENSEHFITADGGKGINPNASDKGGRAADVMYGNTTPEGSTGEIHHHGAVAYHEITHTIDPKAKVRDYTHAADRTLVADKAPEDAARGGFKNHGESIKGDTLNAEAQMAAFFSKRNTSTINTAKVTKGKDGYSSQEVTRTYTDKERTEQEVHNGLPTSSRLDVHQHRAKMLTRQTSLFGDIQKSARSHNKGLRSATEELVRHPTEGRVTERVNSKAPQKGKTSGHGEGRVTERGNNSAPHYSHPHPGRPK